MGRAVVKGDEMGHFTFGSTVVLLLPPDFALDVSAGIELGARVRMGQSLFDGAMKTPR